MEAPFDIEALKAAESLDQLFAVLRPAEAGALSSRHVGAICRTLDRVSGSSSLRVAFLSTHTVLPLPDYVRARCATLGIAAQTYVGPFNQISQELLTPSSELHEFRPDILVIDVGLREVAPEVALEFATLSAAAVQTEQQRIVESLAQWAKVATEKTDALVLVANFPRPARPALGVADCKQKLGEAEFYLSLNLQLLAALKPMSRAYVLDLDRILAAHGSERSLSSKLYYLAKLPWQESALVGLAGEIARFAVASRGLARKAVVLDLDNTLWGGVVGEEGAAGVRIGQGDPVSEAYQDFQRALRNLKARGVLLAVASKNNPADVDEVFELRKDMPLKPTDFAMRSVGWHDKGESLRRLAEGLNIGLDSFVFLDDNPAERAIVRGSVSEVLVPEMPRDPAEYVDCLQACVWFERLQITEEDRAKTEQYIAQSRRSELLTTSGDLGQYLRELDTRLVVRPARASDVPRVHQLFVKTNQFNVTTRRYDVSEVERFVTDPRYRLVLASMSDRFGDMGIIGLYLLESKDEEVVVDSFVMSCRALGRDVESALMNHLKSEAKSMAGARRLRAAFIPTRKNVPARDFFEQQQLPIVRTHDDGGKEYCAELVDLVLLECGHVMIVVEQKEAS